MAEVCITDENSVIEYNVIRQINRSYNLFGYTTRANAENALVNSELCPVTDPDYSSMVRKDVAVSAIQGFDDEWTGTANWQQYIPESLDKETLSGTVAVGSEIVKFSYNHIGSYGPGGTTPSFSGLINASLEGVEGANTDVPVVSFTLNKLYSKGTFTLAWLAGATAYVGLPNTLPWRGFASGEVKLVGIDGTNDANSDYDPISFQFAASPTFTNITIPGNPLGNIVVPQKLGWQYLHVQSQETVVGGYPIQIPVAAHVDELSPGVDLNILIP